MLITNERRNSHYCFVKNLSHLLHPKNFTHTLYHCEGCLQSYHNLEKVKEHRELSKGFKASGVVEMPKAENSIINFKDFLKSR